MIGDIELEKRFKYHHSNTSLSQVYDDIGVLYYNFAKIIDEKCPDSREKSIAITELEFSYMMAIGSISRNDEGEGELYEDKPKQSKAIGKKK